MLRNQTKHHEFLACLLRHPDPQVSHGHQPNRKFPHLQETCSLAPGVATRLLHPRQLGRTWARPPMKPFLPRLERLADTVPLAPSKVSGVVPSSDGWLWKGVKGRAGKKQCERDHATAAEPSAGHGAGRLRPGSMPSALPVHLQL